MDWIWVIFAGLAGGLLSLLLGVLLLFSKNEKIIANFATAFAAGTLLASAFLDLIPEALEHSEEEITTAHISFNSFQIMLFVLGGLIFFFLVEGLLHRFHNHAYYDLPHAEKDVTDLEEKPLTFMVMFGDTIHNFFDGIAIAAGFLHSGEMGWLITLAVVLHEIPQEIGDLAIMRSNGLSKKRVVWLNVLSSLASLFGAIIFYAVGQTSNFETMLPPCLAIVAGFFIYIALTDIVPTIHKETDRKSAIVKMLLLISGVVVLGSIIWLVAV